MKEEIEAKLQELKDKLQELKDKIGSGSTQEIKDAIAAVNQEVMQIVCLCTSTIGLFEQCL